MRKGKPTHSYQLMKLRVAIVTLFNFNFLGIYNNIGGKHWVDKLERWAMESSEVERLITPAHESIYQGHPFWGNTVSTSNQAATFDGITDDTGF